MYIRTFIRRKNVIWDWRGLAFLLRRNPRAHTDWLNWLGNKKKKKRVIAVLQLRISGTKIGFAFITYGLGSIKIQNIFIRLYEQKLIKRDEFILW